jgi:hypothetical protein
MWYEVERLRAERNRLAPNPVDRVRTFLDGGRAWLKGNLGNGAGRWCLVGAVFVLDDEQEYERVILVLAEAIREQYPERIPFRFTGSYLDHPVFRLVFVTKFNDHERTVWPEVDALLDKASVLYTERYEQVAA